MGRPRRVLSRQEQEALAQAWSETGNVQACRFRYQELARLEKPPSWDTVRRWLSIAGLREDPTDRQGRINRQSPRYPKRDRQLWSEEWDQV